MIKFFRNIRQRMLIENKVSRYLLYALGEIALVMIGILLALQVNNWNELEKEKKEEQKLLTDLRSEFSQNEVSLDSVLKKTKDAHSSLSVLIRLIGTDSLHDFKGKKLDSLLIECLDNPYWDRTEFILRDLENSGRLSKLTNKKLKLALYKWSQLNSSISDKDEDANIAYRYFLNYLKVHGSLRQIDIFQDLKEKRSNLTIDHSFLLTDLKFENAIDDFLIYTQQRVERLEKAKIIIEQIIIASDSSSAN